ncbi:hypothetical protein ASPZODRAFT_150178 [Penicilliopsis zonata CBS 506.65]|uniref:Developmental regulatory protein wetA n=1 Tax=Penicilliopsis zonata CBS 506.65 TaxID=1073090 RepID=A0A1L9SPS8_9EURO|nr:hypothetical protein ASPZODRAFT_150178 [Penicilliopsis zonata CBS 506.65]OJJ49262.1 hypothetical protein ASPZODRAFT_150178 [Penicilliopsis zonata CBS 506.65]
MFAQPFDHSFNDLFNQYVNMDSSAVDGNKDLSFPGDFEQLFALDSLSTDCGDLSPLVSTPKRQVQSPQPWRTGAVWCLQEETGLSDEQRNFSLHETIHPAAISDISLSSLEAPSQPPTESFTRPFSTSPSTPPATPSSRRVSKSALVTPKTIRHRDLNDRRGLLRKQSFSPSLIRSSKLNQSRMAYPEAWAQRFQNFNLRSSDEHLPLSPPPSDILVQHENLASDNAAQMTLENNIHPSDSQHTDLNSQYDSSLFMSSPAVEMPSPSAGALARQQQKRYLGHANPSALVPSSPPSADEIFPSSHSSDPSLSSWHSDALGASSLPFTTADLHSHDAQAWWSPMSSRVTQRPTPYQSMAASPTPQRPVQAVPHQNDLLQGGLMIQFDPSFDLPSAPDSTFASTPLHSTPSNPDGRSFDQMAAVHHKFSSSNPFATPLTHHTSRQPSTSPRSSTSPNGHSVHMKMNHRRTHSRKLSAQSNSGPKPVKGPSGSPRGANKAVSVSFVNFTAHDSKKILTGVAPSGSSKTKARREQEAKERRRKLSEAALNAVRNAGGDVEALEAVLC